jgi:ankyrin repeat protein
MSCLLKILGANVIAEDHRGRQVAHFAAMRNHKRILQFLFDQGIDLDCRCEMGKTPVHYAAQYGGECSVMSIILCIFHAANVFNNAFFAS